MLDVAVKFLEGMGGKVQPGKLTGESADYAVAEASSTSADGTKPKSKILVGTDEAKYAANKKNIDEIWDSFELWGGGASSQN